MEFRTIVDIPTPPFQIEPLEPILFVGSCFADNIGQRFREERFPVTVNPYGTMYNPVSVLHTIERWYGGAEVRGYGGAEVRGYGGAEVRRCGGTEVPRVVFITLGTNHIYRLKETGEIVDNCEKRPQRLFTEEVLTIDECAGYLRQIVEHLHALRPDVCIVFTVSPIRYAKYGYHASQLSKATLLTAVDTILNSQVSSLTTVTYFPAYEIVLDELRDYRFYKEDMLHPSDQAVGYIWQQLVEHYFSPAARQFLKEWQPIKEALGHRPFHPESETYQRFLAETRQRETELLARYSR